MTTANNKDNDSMKTEDKTAKATPSAGISKLFTKTKGENLNEFDAVVNLDDIQINAQIREEFEDEDNSLAELGKSLRKKQLQPLVLRLNEAGSEKPYLLIAGERRIRGARIEGLTHLKAYVVEMTDEEAEDAQFAENVHRKNFKQLEEAKKIKRDLDKLGSIEAVMAKHEKSATWISKILALLNLPDQTKRLVSENISADVELINTVKTIEKKDPEKAKALVNDLKETRGKSDARDKAAKVKEEVKPSKKTKAAKSEDSDDSKPYTPPATPAWLEQQRKKDAERAAATNGENTATPRDRSFEEPSAVEVLGSAETQPEGDQIEIKGMALDVALNEAYKRAIEGDTALKVLEDMAAHKESMKDHLLTHYNAGRDAKDLSRAVMRGLRGNQFATTGAGALALAAFLYGSDSAAKFSLVDIIGSVKA